MGIGRKRKMDKRGRERKRGIEISSKVNVSKGERERGKRVAKMPAKRKRKKRGREGIEGVVEMAFGGKREVK